MRAYWVAAILFAILVAAFFYVGFLVGRLSVSGRL